LSRVSDGLLVAELDLNLCRQVKDKWGFRVQWNFNYYYKIEKSLDVQKNVFTDDATIGSLQSFLGTRYQARL
jgi:hypothetical protein